MFDEQSFLNTEVSGELDTKRPPIPVGEYTAMIDKVDVRAVGEQKDKIMLDIFWAIDNPTLADEISRMNPFTTRQSLFLDVTAQGGLDMSKGKNTDLGHLRDAVGQNVSGPWRFTDLVGKVAVVNVTHRMYEENLYDEVKSKAVRAQS